MTNFPQNDHFQTFRKWPKYITRTDFTAPNHQGGPQWWSRWVRTKSKPFSDMIYKICSFYLWFLWFCRFCLKKWVNHKNAVQSTKYEVICLKIGVWVHYIVIQDVLSRRAEKLFLAYRDTLVSTSVRNKSFNNDKYTNLKCLKDPSCAIFLKGMGSRISNMTFPYDMVDNGN